MPRSEKISREVVDAFAGKLVWIARPALRCAIHAALPALRAWLCAPDPLRDAVVEAAISWAGRVTDPGEAARRGLALRDAVAALANRAGR